MSENLQTDLAQINKFILNAALKKKPVFEAYKNLCDSQGNQSIDYLDFDWKYYQYYHGNQDLTIEKSKENSSPLTFSDLPMDVLEKVVEKSDLIDRFSLRKVSRDLRNLVDTTEVHCEEITICFDDSPSETYLEKLNLNNEKIDFGCRCVVLMKPNFKNQKFHRVNANASTLLKNPKLKVGLMKCEFLMYNECSEFLRILNSQNFQLNVGSIHFDTFHESICPILQAVKPEVLEEISFESWTVETLDEISEMEQWKKAKKLCLENISGAFRMEKCLHFKEIRINDFEFTDWNLIMIRDILLKSTHLESCHLENQVLDYTDYGMDEDYIGYEEEEEVDEDEETIKRIMGEDPAYDPETGRFSIPNSQMYFQLKVEKQYFGMVYGLAISRVSDN